MMKKELELESSHMTLEAPRENKRRKCGDRRQQTGLRNSDGRETRKIHVSRPNLISLEKHINGS
ncbi:hypothetical protein Bca101_083622 [Brassica carinata]